MREDSELVYGRWPVKEALQAGPVNKIFISKSAGRQEMEEIMSLAREKKVAFQWVDRIKLDHMVKGNHQGVVAQIGTLEFSNLDQVMEAAKKNPTKGVSLLFLDSIQDPQNLGSLLRSAVFFGVRGVVIPKWRAAGVTGSVMRASAGAARYIPIAQVANLGTAMEEARKQGFWLVGADMQGQAAKSADLPRPMALVMGAEGPGMHDLVKKRCDVLVTIPKRREGEGIASLNVGVAGGILLHQFS